MRGANGMMDLKKWDCGVPGKEKTLWEGGLFKLEVTFPDEYPTKPPKCTSCSPCSAAAQLWLGFRCPDILTHRRQIRASAIPPQRVPLWHRLPVDPERRRGMEASHHNQGDLARHSIIARRAEPRVTRPGRRFQLVQEGPRCIREEGAQRR